MSLRNTSTLFHYRRSLIEQIDPPRWPRLGEALHVEYDLDGTAINGSDGLGGLNLPCASLHHPHPSDKLIVDIVRQYPHEITLLLLGPTTTVARAFDRDPELANLLKRIIFVGGAWRAPGDVSPVAEMHIMCDPPSTRVILQTGVPITLIPLDVSRELILSPTDLVELSESKSKTCSLLSRMGVATLGVTESLEGVEGAHLCAVTGVAAVSMSECFTTESLMVDIEIQGELTRGMSVVDARWSSLGSANVDLVVEMNAGLIHDSLMQLLGRI